MAKILEEFKNAEEFLEEAKEHEDEMIPVDQWNGECWKTFFDQFCVEATKIHGGDPWDVLANFIKKVFAEGGET